MQLSLQNFTSIVQNSAAAVQGACAQLLDLTVGSVLRAILEANASVVLWLQWLVLQVLTMTRLATSVGADVDSWVADFGMTRLPAVSATGSVTFSRYSTGTAALIVPGATVVTGDGTQTFTVTTDTSNSAWSASQGGYVVPSGTASVTVPVQANNAGTQGNVSAGAISLVSSAIPGIDTVTNASPFANGENAETDAALKARFVNYIDNLAKATDGAIAAAIAGVQQGLSWVIQENTPSVGFATVTVDDGTGSPSSGLLAQVSAAVDQVRPLGSTVYVQGPTITDATISFTLNVPAGVSKAAVIATLGPSIFAYVNALKVGAALGYFTLPSVIFGAAPGQVASIESLLVNSGTADLSPGATGVVKCATLSSIVIN